MDADLSRDASFIVPPASSQAGQIVRELLGFSRALVAVFVVAQAGLAAVFALNEIPSFQQVVFGFLACFTGASALIAYNDLLDVDLDRQRLAYEADEERKREAAGREAGVNPGSVAEFDAAAGTGQPTAGRKTLDIGALLIHHPVARGVISYRLGAVWIVVLSVISMTFTYLLQPWLPIAYLSIIVFVTLYSRLSRKTPLKMLAVATAVTLGGVAGWMAVADPPYGWVFWLFAIWTFVWEIGGRSLPNDFNDVDEDEKMGIKTLPVVYGEVVASRVAIVFLIVTVGVSLALVQAAGLPFWVLALTALLGFFFLLEPGFRLVMSPTPEVSRRLYNRSASYTPAMLLLLAGAVIFT